MQVCEKELYAVGDFMFFMMGITEGRKDLEHNQVFICSHCSTYGRYKRCSSCGYETQEDFEFCPKCGQRF